MLWDVFKTNYIETVKKYVHGKSYAVLWSLPMLVGSAVMLGATRWYFIGILLLQALLQ